MMGDLSSLSQPSPDHPDGTGAPKARLMGNGPAHRERSAAAQHASPHPDARSVRRPHPTGAALWTDIARATLQ